MLNAKKYISMFALLLPCFSNASANAAKTPAPWMHQKKHTGKNPYLNKAKKLEQRIFQLENQVAQFKEQIDYFYLLWSFFYRTYPGTFKEGLPETMRLTSEEVKAVEKFLNVPEED